MRWSIQLADGWILKIQAISEGETLEKGKSSTETILESGSAMDEASVARESAWLLLPWEICEISTSLNSLPSFDP